MYGGTVPKIRPLYPYPALLLDDIKSDIGKKFIAISDLHIGFEDELSNKGITIDSSLFLQEMTDEIIQLIKFHKPDGLLLLGDVKNTIKNIGRQEWQRIPRFFQVISETTEIFLIPGNHDNNIKLLAPQCINITSIKGIVLDGVLLTHGHTMPSLMRSSIKTIVMGHLHPVFQKVGSILNGQRIWIYLKAKKNIIFPTEDGYLEIIIIPSFNRHLYGNYINSFKKSISPIIRRAMQDNALERSIAVTLDGSVVGDISILFNSPLNTNL